MDAVEIWLSSVDRSSDVSYEISRNVFDKMTQLNRMMRENRNKDVESLGLTWRQADVLFFLIAHKGEPVNQVMIEREFHLSNPTVTGILKRLEQKGFIRRITHENDRRCKYIEVTPKTEDLDQEIRRKGAEMGRRALEGIDGETYLIFQRTIDIMYQNMEKLKEEWKQEE